MQVIIESLLREGRLRIICYLPVHGGFKNLCFVSVAPMVCMSPVFVYMYVNKIVVISLANHLHTHMHK